MSSVDVDKKHVSKLFTRKSTLVSIITALTIGVVLGIIGYAAELGYLALPRLEPLFASPFGTVTLFFSILGISVGSLIGWCLTLEDSPKPDENREVKMNRNRWVVWAVAVISVSLVLSAASYIWLLSASYGYGSNNENRIGWTLKNSQRIPGETPEEIGESLARILGGEVLEAPNDPVGVCILAPLASQRGMVLRYGGRNVDSIDQILMDTLNEIERTDIVIIIPEDEPVYGIPAAYSAAYHQVPVIPLNKDPISDELVEYFETREIKTIIVAGPKRLISDDVLVWLSSYGETRRISREDLVKHALVWSRTRLGDFGWGIDEKKWHDGYYYFTLANPSDPEIAAAGISMSYLGNYGPLLFTRQGDLSDLVDQYLWRLQPEFFASPSDGPFSNVRVLGGPELVSYATQARTDLALETHGYRAKMTGASGLSLLSWSWLISGVASAVWIMQTINKRLPHIGFYPQIYWPLSAIVFGPLGLCFFICAYNERSYRMVDGVTEYDRPPWLRALSGSVMSTGVVMTLMIAVMYFFQSRGMPLFTQLMYTSVFWLGTPSGAVMWMVMVLPSIIISLLFYTAPMMSDTHNVDYIKGLRKAYPVVLINMITASIGMFAVSFYLNNLEGLMGGEDLWLWPSSLWLATIAGFATSYIPNYLMVRKGWKEGTQ